MIILNLTTKQITPFAEVTYTNCEEKLGIGSSSFYYLIGKGRCKDLVVIDATTINALHEAIQ